MPNNTNIQPPSFSDFSNTNSDANMIQRDVYYEDPIVETTETAGKIYDLPLSIINHSDSIWFTTFSWALGLSAIMFTIILYSLFRVIQIRLQERKEFEEAPMSPQAELILGHKENAKINSSEERTQQRWQQIETHMIAGTTSDWRLAIIEADIILDELVTSLGYTGEGLGEKLKQIRPDDLNSVDAAWEAHKVRNRIAHEGTAIDLTEREVKRIIGLYRQVFQEAKLIKKM